MPLEAKPLKAINIKMDGFQMSLEAHTPFHWADYKALLEDMNRLRSHLRWSGTPLSKRMGGPSDTIWIDIPKVYRSKLPKYTLAYCPICGRAVQERVDTFSLSGAGWWLTESRGFGWYGRQRRTAKLVNAFVSDMPSYRTVCGHVKAVTYNVSFNGVYPDDVDGFQHVVTNSEAPHIIAPFLEQPGAYAVIHALPVGRTDDKEWRPWYTVFFVSYFYQKSHTLADDDAIWQKSLGFDPKNADRFFFWPINKLDFDLQAWREQDKLLWLDQHQPEQPLANPANPFPYRTELGLQGRWAVYQGILQCLPNQPWSKILNRRAAYYRQVKREKQTIIQTYQLKQAKQIDRNKFMAEHFAWYVD